MNTYHGWRDADGTCHVEVIPDSGGRKRRLRLRLDLDNHSPTGFEWGYGGSGPAQLALALLADATGNDRRAVKLHQRFKWKIIAPIKRDEEWFMTGLDVCAAATVIETTSPESDDEQPNAL
jgi:hypothetical protein